jgi:transposase
MLAAEDVILSYKNLMNVERAFREIKNFLDVGPLRHWNERRVRGHIFICVLAYLFEQELQVMYRRYWQHQRDEAMVLADPDQRQKATKELDRTWFSGEHLIKELRRWSVMKAEFLGKEFLSVPPPPGDAKHMLEAMGIPLPDKSIVIS